MKNQKILIIDSHYLCYRSMFTIGDLSYDEKDTGVIFGFLNQILQLADRFDYPKFLFTWDSKKSFRRDIYPEYKAKDREMTLEMLELLAIAKPQFQEIRIDVLPALGFRNNFIQTGLEADDLIAKIVEEEKPHLDHDYPVIIVSADNDLYQLLDNRISMYNPKTKKIYGAKDFIKEWGINPYGWVQVKTLAGCSGDNIKGLKGVGEKTAIKWLQGKLRKGKMAESINNNRQRLLKNNEHLIKLPYPGTQPVKIVKDEFYFQGFEGLCLDYGFRSFLKKETYGKWKKLLGGG